MADPRTPTPRSAVSAGALPDGFDPRRSLTQRNLQKKRSAVFTCFLAAFLLMLLSAVGAVAYQAVRKDLFQSAVDRYVVASGLLSASDAEAFVTETMDYLTGARATWDPAVTVAGLRVSVPDSFKAHMANVRGWLQQAGTVFWAVGALVLLLLGRSLIGVQGSGHSRFSMGGYYLGAVLPLLALAGLGLWGYLDFDGLWAWLHETLIPDGIFSAGEAIMQLFPVEVFQSYLQPVGLTFAAFAGATFALPLVLAPLGWLLTALFGKASPGAGRGRGTPRASDCRKPAGR